MVRYNFNYGLTYSSYGVDYKEIFDTIIPKKEVKKMPIIDADTDVSDIIFYYSKGGGWKVCQQINLDVEWYKWLRYESEIEKERVDLINSKNVNEITHKDIEFLKRQKELPNFKKNLDEYFLKHNCNPEISKVVVMCHENPKLLEKIMIDKLTEEELLEAEKKLLNYKQIKELDILGEIVNNFENSYNDLSYVDAFVYHYLADYYYYRSYRDGIQGSNEAYSQRARVYAKALQNRDANIHFRF